MKKLLVILSVIIVGCSTVKKADKEKAQLQVFAVRYPDYFKVLANTMDPCFPEKAKSDTVTKIDSVMLPGKRDTIIKKGKGDTVIKTITTQLPGIMVRMIVKIHDTVTDQRALNALHSIISGLDDSISVSKDDQKKLSSKLKTTGDQDTHRLLWIIGLIAIIVIYLGVKVYSFFSGGAIVKAGSGLLNIFKK